MINNDQAKIWYALSFAFELGFIIAIPIGGFTLAGLWADNTFHTSPWLLFAGIIFGLIITIAGVYNLLRPITDK